MHHVISTAAFKASFLGDAKYEITLPFQYNGFLSGIMNDNFSFSILGFSTRLKKWNFVLLTECNS